MSGVFTRLAIALVEGRDDGLTLRPRRENCTRRGRMNISPPRGPPRQYGIGKMKTRSHRAREEPRCCTGASLIE